MLRTLLVLAVVATVCGGAAADVLLDGGAGLQWRVVEVNSSLYALGQPLLNMTAIDSSVDDGIAFWRRESDFLVVPVLANSLAEYGGASAALSGTAVLPVGPTTGATTHVSVTLSLSSTAPGVSIRVAFSSDVNITGWQLCVKWAHDGPTPSGWRVSGYPLAGNTTSLQPTGLDYMGWPGFFFQRPDASVVAHFALDTTDDYLNPTTWTGKTQFTFVSADANGGDEIAPQASRQAFPARAVACLTSMRVLARASDSDAVLLWRRRPRCWPGLRCRNDALLCAGAGRRAGEGARLAHAG